MRKIKNTEEQRKTEVVMSCLSGEIKAYQAASVRAGQVENESAGRTIANGQLLKTRMSRWFFGSYEAKILG